MTHMTNYGNDQLALYTVSRLVNFVHRWTNLELKYAEPTELADIYFKLFPKDKVPVWLVSYVFIFLRTKEYCSIQTKTRSDSASVPTYERRFRGDFCNGAKRRRADLECGASHIGYRISPNNGRGGYFFFCIKRGATIRGKTIIRGRRIIVCKRLVPVLCRCWSCRSRKAFRVGMKSYPA